VKKSCGTLLPRSLKRWLKGRNPHW